jgi:hypothetical protein
MKRQVLDVRCQVPKAGTGGRVPGVGKTGRTWPRKIDDTDTETLKPGP